jgi:hypothetical protein
LVAKVIGEVGQVGATTVDANVLELIVFNLSPINLIKLVKVVEPRVIFLSPKVDELGK